MNPVLLVGIFSQYLTRDILCVDSEGNLWGKKPQQIKTPQNATGKLKFPESGVSLIMTLISQAKQSIFAIWATVFSRKSAHQRACGWQHIPCCYCSERGRLLLSEPDCISFFGVLKGYCAHSSAERVSFTGWKSKLWGLAHLSGVGVAPGWDAQCSGV